MRDLTDRQRQALDRIANSAAGPHVKVVGWVGDTGPVLRTKHGRLAVLLPSNGELQEIEEATA